MPPGMIRQPLASWMRVAFSVGSWAAMAVTLSPLMPTSAREVSVAVTTVPLRITVSKRIGAPQGTDFDRFGNGWEGETELPPTPPRAFHKNIKAKDLQNLHFINT